MEDKNISIKVLDGEEDAKTIAKWLFEEWGHKVKGKTLEDSNLSIKKYINSITLPICLVAHCKNKIAGTVILKNNDMQGREDLNPWLSSLFVSNEYRNLGIGKALIKGLEKQAKKLGLNSVYLFTPNARNLYEKSGWIVIEHTNYDLFEPNMKVVIMKKNIS